MDTARTIHALVGINLVAGAWSFVVDGVTPSWVVYPLLLLISLGLLRRSLSAAAGYLGGLAAVFTLMHLPFATQALSSDCTHPANPALGCNPTTWIVTLAVVPTLTALVSGYVWWQARRSRVEAVQA